MKFRWKTIAAKWKSLSNRQKYIAGLSAIIFILIVGTLLKSCKDTPDKSLVGRRIPVVLTPATLQIFEQRVVVQGNVEAKEFAMVSPRVQGIIEAIFVDEGDFVIANETKLFQTDALKLKKTVEIEKHELAVAQCEKREKAANLEKIEADLHKTELDYNRFKRLFEKQAVTADAFEQQESRYKQILAFRKHVQAQVDLSAEKEHQANAALAISEKDLADAIVRLVVLSDQAGPVHAGKNRHIFLRGFPGDPGTGRLSGHEHPEGDTVLIVLSVVVIPQRIRTRLPVRIAVHARAQIEAGNDDVRGAVVDQERWIPRGGGRIRRVSKVEIPGRLLALAVAAGLEDGQDRRGIEDATVQLDLVDQAVREGVGRGVGFVDAADLKLVPRAVAHAGGKSR